MNLKISSSGSGSYSGSFSKDTPTTNKPTMLQHMQRVSDVDHEQLSILLDLMTEHPNELVDATLKNFVSTLKLTHSDLLSDRLRYLKQVRQQQELHAQAQHKAIMQTCASMEQDLDSELDMNVLALRGMLLTMLDLLYKGASYAQMTDRANKELIALLKDILGDEFQLTSAGWFSSRTVLRATDKQRQSMIKQVTNAPHGKLRERIACNLILQSTDYKNKFRQFMDHQRYAKSVMNGFTGSHDVGV